MRRTILLVYSTIHTLVGGRVVVVGTRPRIGQNGQEQWEKEVVNDKERRMKVSKTLGR